MFWRNWQGVLENSPNQCCKCPKRYHNLKLWKKKCKIKFSLTLIHFIGQLLRGGISIQETTTLVRALNINIILIYNCLKCENKLENI